MQGNFAQWLWKVGCAVVLMGLIGSVAEAGTRRVSSKYCPPAKPVKQSKPYCPPPKETCAPEPPKCEPAPPVCEPKPVCEPEPVCESKPVCEPKPSCEPQYETSCQPKQPTCDYNVDCLRSTLCEIAKEVQCFQVKARCVKRPDIRVIKAVINFVTSLVRCLVQTYTCNSDCERSISCVENSCSELEYAVKCSRNSELECLVQKIRCLVKKLAECRNGNECNNNVPA